MHPIRRTNLERFPRIRAAALMLGLFACVATGCTGGGQIELLNLDLRSIDPPPPRVGRFPAQECYWWTDERDRLWIVARHHQTWWPFSPIGGLSIHLSLRLDKLPSDTAREYTLQTRELRAVAHAGPLEVRYSSQLGIAAVYVEPNEQLRVSARVQAGSETRQLLGWSAPRRNLMLLNLRAVRDRGAGRAWVELTEAGGWERDPAQTLAPILEYVAPASQPVSP